MWQAGILIIYLIHHAHTTWTTHSRCPALNQSVRCKSYPKFDQCQTDTNCPGGKICCPQKCGKECITPSLPIGNRPGCPVCLGTQSGTECPLCVHFQNLCNADTECKAGQLCCYNPSCGTWCNNKKPVKKPGQCPPNLPGSICPLFVRPGDCINDGSCPGKQKCCRQGCSSGCVDPGPICNQPDQVCAVFCPFGNVLDENNCPIFCKCKTGCAGNAEPKPLSSCGEGQQICPSRYQCTIPPEGGIGVCCPYECPQVKCSEPCPYCFVIDANGCQTCECEPRCGPVCAISCPFGNVLDETNCPICECKTGCAGNVNPKPLTSCGSGQQRCPSQYQCNMPPLGGSGVCCPYVCPQIKCSRPCPNGYKYDVNGCQTCQCLPGSACEKDTPHGTCRLGPFPSTPCPAGSYCKDPYCCRIPCKFGVPHPSISCGMVIGSNNCPAGYSCLAGPADEYFACCPDENKPTPDKCPKDRYPKSKCYVRRSCKNDSSCRGNKKCCKQGCQYKCVAPVY